MPYSETAPWAGLPSEWLTILSDIVLGFGCGSLAERLQELMSRNLESRPTTKEQLVWDLARFGVHRAMLFPDIDGLAEALCVIGRHTAAIRSQRNCIRAWAGGLGAAAVSV
jgi:hypothetical protein